MDTAAELDNARALRRLGRHKAAAEICRRILDRQPSRPDALLVLAAIADDLGDHRAAVGFLTRIVDRNAHLPGAAVLLAEVLQKLGALDGAVAWYRAALDTAEDDAERAAPALARLLADQGDTDGVATLAAEQLAENRPAIALEVGRIGRSAKADSAVLALVEGRALLALSRADEAEGPLAAAVAARPDDPEALRAFGLASASPAWLARAVRIRPDVASQAELGAALQACGRGDEAESWLAAALAADRGHGPALRARARLLLDRGEADAAIGLMRRRLADDPDDIDAAGLLGTALARRGLAASAITYAQSAAKAGRAEAARATAEGVVGAEPGRLEAWREIGTPRAFRILLAHDPADAAAMRGVAARAEADAALTWLERAIRVDTGAATALALAQALARAGGKDAARALARPLLAELAARPRPEAAALAALLADLGEAEAAARLFERVVAQAPDDEALATAQIEALAKVDDAASLTRIGQAHLAASRPRLAAKAFAAVRRLKPENEQIAFLHGRALWDADDKSAAVDAFADAAESAGDANLDLLNRAGEALVGLQAPDLGLRYLRRVIELDFGNPARHTYSYFFNFLNQCDWPARADYISRLTELGEARIAADDPAFLINPSLWVFLGAERDLLYRSADHFARHSFPDAVPRIDKAGGDPERPIRLGYLSAFLHGHHIGYSLIGILQAHDRNQVQVHLYGQTRDDSVQAELKRQAHVFRPIDGKSPAAIAQMIGGDGVDVLVDLDGYVNGASGLLTLEVASRRAAPVQMLYHNYVGPTGTGFVDYVIADHELLDAHDDAGYRERLLRIPPCYYPAAPLPKAAVRTERRAWGLPEDGAVFCNFGHFYKLEPTCFDSWMRILRRVPGSVLWMNHWDTPAAVANLRREAEARGVAPDRLVFSPLAEKPMHLARLGLADLFLDTFVYASGVTSLDVLWGGVPVVTIRGSTFARRVGASLNAGIGLGELTCADPAAFEELAVALATDTGRLEAIKARLRANLPTHPLFDQARLARDLERAYRTAFRRSAAGLPPQSAELPPLSS